MFLNLRGRDPKFAISWSYVLDGEAVDRYSGLYCGLVEGIACVEMCEFEEGSRAEICSSLHPIVTVQITHSSHEQFPTTCLL